MASWERRESRGIARGGGLMGSPGERNGSFQQWSCGGGAKCLMALVTLVGLEKRQSHPGVVVKSGG